MVRPARSSRSAAAPGTAPIAAAVDALLRDFHRQRPIRGGSLLITIFGDSIAPRGGAITLGSLIDLARPFGLAERLVRTSVARLARDGWLVGTRNGRRSEYRLAPSGQQRFAEATRRIYGPIPSSWNGEWTLLVLPPASGGRAQNVRDELRWLGFGQVSPGVFAHANWNLGEARTGLDGLEGIAEGLLFKSSSESLKTDRRLVATGWNLGELARRYRKFVATFSPILEAAEPATSGAQQTSTRDPQGPSGPQTRTWDPPGYGELRTPTRDPHGPNALQPPASDPRVPGALRLPTSAPRAPGSISAEAAFVIRTLLIHEYRKIHLQDPLLPPGLLPDDWVGAAAYELSRRVYSAVFEAAEAHLSATACRMTEPLPRAEAATYERFGGLARSGSLG